VRSGFGERAVLNLMYAALIRAAKRWRGLRMTEFECRQLNALRNEVDRAHAERTTGRECTRHRIPSSFIQQDSDLIAMVTGAPSRHFVGRASRQRSDARLTHQPCCRNLQIKVNDI
jgi:hypothetical protein